MSQQRKGQQRQSLRQQDGGGSGNMFNLRKGLRDVIVVMLFFNIINVILYNTGWIDWKDDTFDTMWATGIVVGNLFLIAMLSILDK